MPRNKYWDLKLNQILKQKWTPWKPYNVHINFKRKYHGNEMDMQTEVDVIDQQVNQAMPLPDHLKDDKDITENQ